MPHPMSTLVKSLQWPQVAALAVLVAGAVLVSIFAPEDVRGPLVGLLTGLAGWLKVRP
jgi:hypothetical protein